jgi:MFS family permease
MQTGFFVGPLLAGLALTWIDVRLDIALTTALIVFALPGAIAASGTTQSGGAGFALRGPMRALVAQRAFLPVTIGLLGSSLIWGTVQAFLPVFGREALGLPSYMVGYLIAVQAIANAVSRPLAGRLVDRAARRWPIVFVGTLVFAASTIVIGHLTGFGGPAAVLAVGTPFIAASFVAIGVVFGDLSAGSTRGVTMGSYGSILFLGLSVGPLAFGPIVQADGYAAGFTACAAGAVILATVMAALNVEPVRRRMEVALPRPGPPSH